MNITDVLTGIVLSHLGPTKQSNKGWSTRNCMLCHLSGESADNRGRFGIIFPGDGSIAVRCFNCNFRAKYLPGSSFSKSFISFLTEIGVPESDIKRLNFEIFRSGTEVELSDAIKLKGSVTSKWKTMALPPDTRSLYDWATDNCADKDFLKVLEYAYSRGIRNLKEIHWSPSKSGQTNKRFILPFYYKGNIVGYTARYAGNTPSKLCPKYMNYMPDNYVYNLDHQLLTDRKYVVLAEGVLDAYLVDGISTLNNTINDAQIELINNLNKTIIVCPDRDNAGSEFVKTAIAQGWQVSFPEWATHTKDPAAAIQLYGRILTLTSLVTSAEKNPITIQLKWNLESNVRNQRVHKGN